MNGCCMGEAHTGHHDDDCWWVAYQTAQIVQAETEEDND